MEHCGAMETIRRWLNHLSRNRVAQIVIVGWSFQFLIEGATILALQSVGGAMGNMVAIHNIVAVCSVLGLGKAEGEILKKTVGPMLLYGAIAAAVGLLL